MKIKARICLSLFKKHSLAIIIVQQSGERSFLVIYFSVLSFLLAKHSYTLIQTHLCSLGVAGVGE